MKLLPAESVLLTGGTEEVYDFFDNDRSVIIDWKNEVGDTLCDFQRFLPEGFFAYEYPDDGYVILCISGRTTTVVLDPKYPGIPLANTVRSLLLPEFEAPCIRDSLGSDTACYFVRPAAWWREFRTEYPERYELLFSDADHS